VTHFFAYDALGRIVMAGTCPRADLEHQSMSGATIAEGVAGLDTHYFDLQTEQLVSMPPRPSADHVFDYIARRWKQSPAQAEANVRARRASEYPSVGAQLDALWHAMDAGELPMIAAFYEPIAAVKARYPKPAKGGNP
jgi:hypothetical protein